MDTTSKTVRIGFLVLLTLVAYSSALRGGFVWDDDAHVTENPTLTSPGGLRQIWLEPEALPQYYPLVHTTFWVERHLWGLAPFGYHLVNVLLHALNAVLLGWLLERLSVKGAWLAAAIFALHPVHVESVAWITERKNVLSGAFYLAAALCLIRFYGLDDRQTSRPRWGWYAAGGSLFLCALLSKTVTATLPAALLILLWWKRDRIRRQELLPLVPLFALGAAFAFLTVWIEKHHVGARGDLWDLSPLARTLLAARAPWFYAAKLVWPARLAFFYPRWRIDPAAGWQYLFPLATASILVLLWGARRRIGKGPLAAIVLFGITLVPALGFVDVYPMRFSWVADHFQYLASAGLIALFSAIAVIQVARLGPLGTQAGRIAAAVLLTLLGGLTWLQGRIYRDAETLWRDTIVKSPTSWSPHNNLGVILMEHGDAADAIREYSEAARLAPESWVPHRNLGIAFRSEGRGPDAIQEYSEALRLNPEVPEAHFDLANLLAETGAMDAAVEHYQQAMRLDPQDPAIPYSFGNALLESGRGVEAIERYEQALRLDPEHVDARINLGNALAGIGRNGEAIEQYQEALRRKPNVAQTHNNLAVALVRWGKYPEAIEQYQEALRLDPAYADAANNLGLALASLGRLPEAIESYRQALRARPEFAEAHNNLGVALASSSRIDEAVEQFEQAVRIKPGFNEARANLEATRGMRAASPSRAR